MIGSPPKGIDITKLTDADIGRFVIYRAAPNYAPEEGPITSFNHKYVFVRYGHGSTSAATDPKDLDWSSRDEYVLVQRLRPPHQF